VFDGLCAVTASGSTAVKVNDPFVAFRVGGLMLKPSSAQTINDKITGFRSVSKVDGQLIVTEIENTKRHQYRLPL